MLLQNALKHAPAHAKPFADVRKVMKRGGLRDGGEGGKGGLGEEGKRGEGGLGERGREREEALGRRGGEGEER